MNKKSRMGSISCVQLDSNSIVGILEFSRISERRMMSFVSLVYKETFDKTRESCTRIALKRLVEERRLRYEFPVVNNIYCPIVLCIPREFEPRRILSYLIDQLLQRYIVNGTKFFCDNDKNMNHKSFKSLDLFRYI